jgi:aconitate hydratase
MDVAPSLNALLRERGPIGAFVAFVGPGVAALSLPDQATISKMAPEYGVTIVDRRGSADHAGPGAR